MVSIVVMIIVWLLVAFLLGTLGYYWSTSFEMPITYCTQFELIYNMCSFGAQFPNLCCNLFGSNVIDGLEMLIKHTL